MVDITKDKMFKNRLDRIININNKKKSKLINLFEENKAIILLVTSFLMLAISNGFLVYNFFRILSKI